MKQVCQTSILTEKQPVLRTGSSSIPLSMLPAGTEVYVQSVNGKQETKKFLENLGFIENTPVRIVSEINGNIIVEVKGSRIALCKALAARIYAEER
ncbi:ferrous iron transport protein A [Brucepastera parasyntrophica]|uniref:FeoA family protein n=1 Tax=Brucepastera parasyntrophica TaxID=2880008 RepID=UPI002109249A|nr:FeoA family protein [Brucepastera parasyntrophica]ULQ60748.1 ferrous iron transport protein A [Brucepastera parasyntrophica]